MTIRNRLALLGLSAALLAASAPLAHAQWSIGAPGSREAPVGKQRYVYVVFANPTPGQEVEFNDWYQNVHMGDLIQLPGVLGGQRFRLETAIKPRPTKEGYRFGYVVIWDEEEVRPDIVPTRMYDAIRGGKTRLSPSFGDSLLASYQAISGRIVRPDGVRAFMPDPADLKTPRPNRYLVIDFADPAPNQTGLEAELRSHVNEVLGTPGWMAAQIFKAPPLASGAAPPTPQFMTIWEIEAETPQAAQDALTEAVKAGKIKPLDTDATTAAFTYWRPISPYVVRDDFVR